MCLGVWQWAEGIQTDHLIEGSLPLNRQGHVIIPILQIRKLSLQPKLFFGFVHCLPI